jgi:superfamily I DNA and/or RNA helicase
MLEFQKHLIENNDNNFSTNRVRILQPILFLDSENNIVYKFSVQCHECAFCVPRATLPIGEYKEYEFSIINANENRFLNDKEIKNLVGALGSDISEFFDDFAGTLYTYVPSEIVEEIFLKMKEKFEILDR